jgi:hypothetical protein
MLSGFYVTGYWIKNIWPAVSMVSTLASIFMIDLYIAVEIRNKKLQNIKI